ncbi:MAG TPA: hypothetical protein VNZ58_01125, partial [Thermomicrobiales bacterium]|nr:hypothetical protein [Thermomicrobiales bacterium]
HARIGNVVSLFVGASMVVSFIALTSLSVISLHLNYHDVNKERVMTLMVLTASCGSGEWTR